MFPDGSSVSSNVLSFSNTTVCDEYEVDIEKREMYSAEGLTSGITNPNDYIYIKYELSSNCDYNSRGVINDSY